MAFLTGGKQTTINSTVTTSLSAYGNGGTQNTLGLKLGPSLTIGTFTKPFLAIASALLMLFIFPLKFLQIAISKTLAI